LKFQQVGNLLVSFPWSLTSIGDRYPHRIASQWRNLL